MKTILLLVALSLVAIAPAASADICLGSVCMEPEPLPVPFPVPECLGAVVRVCGDVVYVCEPQPHGMDCKRVTA